jgi:hypothetical protein
MPIHKVKISNILHTQQIEMLSYILQDVSKEYNIDYDELQEKYINVFYKKKRKQRLKGLQNPYTIFLNDKEVDNEIRKNNDVYVFGDVSILKGKMWRNLSKDEKEVYRLKSVEVNKKILSEKELQITD